MRQRRFGDIFDVMRREMEDLVENSLFGFDGDLEPGTKYLESAIPGKGDVSSRYPAEARIRRALADFWETDKEVVATVELPGVNKEDIDINVDEDALEIKVEKKDEDKKEGENEYSYRRSYAGFYRRIPLSKDVDPDKVKATYKNGILDIRIPKKEPEKRKSKKIAIE